MRHDTDPRDRVTEAEKTIEKIQRLEIFGEQGGEWNKGEESLGQTPEQWLPDAAEDAWEEFEDNIDVQKIIKKSK